MMMQSHVDGMIQGVPPPEGSNELWELHLRYLGRHATHPFECFVVTTQIMAGWKSTVFIRISAQPRISAHLE